MNKFKEGSKTQINYIMAAATARRTIPSRMEPYFKRIIEGPPLKANEKMQYEGVRLMTFKDWPRWGAVWPTVLAKAGFFYTKTADQVACFCCGGRLKTWEAGDSPMTEHKRFFPRCRFVRGRDSTNVPLGETPEVPSCGQNSSKSGYYSQLANSSGPAFMDHSTAVDVRGALSTVTLRSCAFRRDSQAVGNVSIEKDGINNRQSSQVSSANCCLCYAVLYCLLKTCS